MKVTICPEVPLEPCQTVEVPDPAPIAEALKLENEELRRKNEELNAHLRRMAL